MRFHSKSLQLFYRSLRSLGALQCKMRIQANDDVYETTLHRLAAAEENHKKSWYVIFLCIMRVVQMKPVHDTRRQPPALRQNGHVHANGNCGAVRCTGYRMHPNRINKVSFGPLLPRVRNQLAML
jgi:hypothetical protein